MRVCRRIFERLYNIFGIRMEASVENLRALRNKEFDLGEKTEAIANALHISRTVFNQNWHDISEMLTRIQLPEFTDDLLDSFQNGWKYNWFCLDHVGFTGENPRRRDSGDHKVYDFYTERCSGEASYGSVQWHYHPLPITGHYHNSGITYLNSSNVTEILAKKVIDRSWFQVATDQVSTQKDLTLIGFLSNGFLLIMPTNPL